MSIPTSARLLTAMQLACIAVLAATSPSWAEKPKEKFPTRLDRLLFGSDDPKYAPPTTLERVDPATANIPGLIRVHGNPHEGLPGGFGYEMQRVGNQDKWCLPCNTSLLMMELNPDSGRLETREGVKAQGEWCLSPDGTKLFVERPAILTRMPQKACECFDWKTGATLWTTEIGFDVVDASFSSDGKHVIVLHCERDEKKHSKDEAVVSWYSAETGKEDRRVIIPGAVNKLGGQISRNYIGETQKAVYILVPRADDKPEAWIITPDSQIPASMPLQLERDSNLAQILVGGRNKELLAIYTDESVELLREKGGSPPVSLSVTDLPPPKPGGYSFTKCLRFSPDHSQLLVSTNGKSWMIPTNPGSGREVKEFPVGWRMFDYTLDGKHVVGIDAGGGSIRSSVTLEQEKQAEKNAQPKHCCPIADTGYSAKGDFIISCDGSNLLLWTKRGEILAELVSPNNKDGNCIRMQSPIIVDRLMKVYAADGFDFLEWDLLELGDLPKSIEGISLRVPGRVVFRDRKSSNKEAELMNIRTDPSETHVVTATRAEFYYRSLDDAGQKTQLLVPKDQIIYAPRTLYVRDNDPKILVQNGSETLSLDPLGKENAIFLSHNNNGVAGASNSFFLVSRSSGESRLSTMPFGLEQKPADSMLLPERWEANEINTHIASLNDRWIAAFLRIEGTLCLAIIDWTNKKVVQDFPLPWSATSIRLSPDASVLLLGAGNRCIYVFDFKKMCAGSN